MEVAPTEAATRQPLAIAVDTNLLVDAWAKENPRHQQAAELMDSLEFGTSEWAIPDACLYEYYQSVTSSKKFKNPATPKEAREQIEFWLALPHVVILCEFADDEDDHWACLTDILDYAEIKGLDVFDSHIAAVCITHHVGELWTNDKGYGRFRGLTARDPLTGIVHGGKAAAD